MSNLWSNPSQSTPGTPAHNIARHHSGAVVRCLRWGLACLTLAAGAVHAGVQEEYPEFFPKKLEETGVKNGWDELKNIRWGSEIPFGLLPSWIEFHPAEIAGWNAEDFTPVEELLAANHAPLEAMMQAAHLQCSGWRTFALIDSSEAPDIGTLDLMRVTHARLCQAIISGREGKYQEAVDTGLKIARFGIRLCEAEPLGADLACAGMLVRLGAGAAAAGAMLPGGASHRLCSTAEELEKLEKQAREAAQQGLLGEVRWSLRFSETMRAGGEGRRKMIIDLAAVRESLEPKAEEVSEWQSPEEVRKKWRRSLPERVRAALRDADKVDWQKGLETNVLYWKALLKADMRSLPAFRASFQPPDTKALLAGTALAPIFNWDIGGPMDVVIINNVTGTLAFLRQMRALLLIRVYETDHGRMPASLNELVPGYWKEVPVDPADEKPLRYDAATRKLWSVGINGSDDGGAGALIPEGGPDDWAVPIPERE